MHSQQQALRAHALPLGFVVLNLGALQFHFRDSLESAGVIPWLRRRGTMRPKRHETTGSSDLFRARLDQIINTKHELAQLAGKIDWDWIDREIAPLYSDKGRPGIETRFAIGLLLLKHIYGLSDEAVCERSALRHRSGDRPHEGRGPSRAMLSQGPRRRRRRRHPPPSATTSASSSLG